MPAGSVLGGSIGLYGTAKKLMPCQCCDEGGLARGELWGGARVAVEADQFGQDLAELSDAAFNGPIGSVDLHGTIPSGRLQLSDFGAMGADGGLPLRATIDVAGMGDQDLKGLDALGLGCR